VDFNRDDVKNVPLEVLLSYCDGDVSDLQGIHFVDDVRYAAGDSTPKHATLVMGGNHNYYNTQWTPGIGPPGAADDWTAFVSGGPNDVWCGTVAGNHRLTPAQQRGVGAAYVVAFFRRYLGGETAFSALWKGDAPPPPSAMTTEIHQSYLPGEGARLDVNRYSTPAELTVNTLGGAVTPNALATYLRCGVDFHCLQTPPASTAQQPHTTPSARSSRRGLSQARLAWNEMTAFLENDIPSGSGDVSGLSRLQFRASINIQDSRNTPGTPQDFSVMLTDAAGNSATTQVSTVSDALFYPPGNVIPVPKVFLNTVRIPLACFPEVDLTNVQSVVFNFDQRMTGGLLVSDLQFAD